MISVCMAAYNGEKYIEQQIDSILKQLGEGGELIISDDGSTDTTISKIRGFNDQRIKLVINHGIHGCAHNFENALKQAKGDYIFFSDQDDVWLPNKVATIIPHLSKNVLVLSNGYITNEKLEIQKELKEYRMYKPGYFFNLYKSIYMGCTSAFTREIKEYCLPFPKTMWVPYDNWVGLLCELKFKVMYIEEPLILYRKHGNNLSDTGEKNNIYRFTYRFISFIETIRHSIKKAASRRIYHL